MWMESVCVHGWVGGYAETCAQERRKKQTDSLTVPHQDQVYRGFPGGAVVETLPANAGDTGSSPGLGRSHMPRSN